VSELDDMLGKILSSPDEMEKISKMASELFGGGGPEKSQPQDISAILGSLMGGSGGSKAGLADALGTYLKPERRRKLEKALKISRLAGVAELAMRGMGDLNE